jgi:hypothetical protein
LTFCMYWVLERRAQDETWEAVVSNITLKRHSTSVGAMAGTYIGAHDPSAFAILSGQETSLRSQTDVDLEPFATPGYPSDISNFARGLLHDEMEADNGTPVSRKQDPGHFMISRLARAAASGRSDVRPLENLPPDAPAADYLRRLYRRLQVVLGRKGNALAQTTNMADREILVGRVTPLGSGGFHLDGMNNMSHHGRLQMRERKNALAPCTDENLRLLIGYGMMH